MYETKKDNALKTLEKKQAKVEEINKVPTLPAPSCLAAPLRARRALCWVAPFFLRSGWLLRPRVLSHARAGDSCWRRTSCRRWRNCAGSAGST